MLNELDIVKFATEELQKPFEWGFNDCNALAVRFLDKILTAGSEGSRGQGVEGEGDEQKPENLTSQTVNYKPRFYSDQVVGKYSTMREAIEFQKEFGKRAEDILKEAGAEEAQPGFERTGDFLLVDSDKWQMCHIYINGKALSAGPEFGVAMFPLNRLAPYKVMRVA